MKCLKCGTENSNESKFCSTCGNPLNQVENNQNMGQVQQQTYNQQQSVYTQPTQPVYTQQPMHQNMQPNKKKGNPAIIIICCIVGFLFLLAIIIVPIVVSLIDKASRGEINITVDENNTIDDDSKENTNNNSKYSVGDAIALVDGSKWHVLGYNNDGNIILISDELVVEKTGYGKSAAVEDQKYENSIVKDYVENTYRPELEKSLKNNKGTTDGLVVRLLTAEEFLKGTGKSWGERCYYTVNYSARASYKIEDGNFVEFYNDEWSTKFTDADKFAIVMSLTNNFWTMSNMDERNSSDCEVEDMYHGSYYIKSDTLDLSSGAKSASTNLTFDWEAVYTTSGKNFGESTSAGIRPVIETSIKNIKK